MDDSTLDFETLEALTDPEQVRALEEPLAHLEKDIDILLFMSPGCAVCPHQLRSVATVMLASPRVGLEVVDASREPELAAQYEIRSVPTTVIDDELVMVGVIPPAELARRLIERQSPDKAGMVFRGLLQSGRLDGAAERLADGRATHAFLEIWLPANPEQRATLLRVAGEALLYDPFGLAPLAPDLLAALDTDAASARDDDWRADTATLLGRIGDPDARPVLERLAGDPDPVVADAARAALAELEE
jgi:hypothetical protein